MRTTARETPTLVNQSPIAQVMVVAYIERRQPGFSYREPSWPGHQLQFVEQGRLHVETGGRTCDVGPGTIMWFHDNEDVSGRVLETPWRFYSINFLAPSLPPPDFERRFVRGQLERVRPRFAALYEAWLKTEVPPLVRLFTVQARLLDLLAEVITADQHTVHVGQETALWWQVEAVLRRHLNQPIDLKAMSQLVNRSPATVTRSCRQAVGTSPCKRFKQLRLSLARRLVWMSDLTISEVADRAGYARLHEFSRDYHKHFGVTPTTDRQRFPQIYKREFLLPFTANSNAPRDRR